MGLGSSRSLRHDLISQELVQVLVVDWLLWALVEHILTRALLDVLCVASISSRSRT